MKKNAVDASEYGFKLAHYDYDRPVHIPATGGAPDINIEKENKINESIQKARKLGDLTLEDMMDDKMDPILKNKIASKLHSLKNEVITNTRSDIAKRSYMGEADADTHMFDSFHINEEKTTGRFIVEKAIATLKASGDKIPVWLVVDSKTNKKLDKIFKIYEAALCVCNEINNKKTPSHPDVIGIIEAYDKYNEVLKNISSTKLAIKNGQVEKKARLSVLRERLETYGNIIGL